MSSSVSRSAPNLARVAIVGSSCSGKTSAAASLSALLGCPHIELDALQWGPGWTAAPPDVFRERTRQAVGGAHWVSDGNYPAVRDLVWSRATALVWLDFSFPLVFGRAVRRTFGRVVTRERLYSDNRESLWQIFDPEWIPWWVIRTYRRKRREYPQLLRQPEHAHLDVVHLHTPAELERFIEALRSEA